MNWFAIWASALLRRQPPQVVYADDHERAAAVRRQDGQRTRVEVLEREAETYHRRRRDAEHR